jgi:hypothetical protein
MNMRPIRALGFMLLGSLLSASPVFAKAGDSQVVSVMPRETVRVTGVLLEGASKPTSQNDLPEGAYSYVKLDQPIDFFDSGGVADGVTYRHQQTLGVAASSTALATSLDQYSGKHVALVGHVVAAVDSAHFVSPFDLFFVVTEPIEIDGK